MLFYYLESRVNYKCNPKIIWNKLKGLMNPTLYINKMSRATQLQNVKNNANVIEQQIQKLKNELNDLTGEFNKLRAHQLREENLILTAAVEKAKGRLINLEIANGIKQIQVPSVNLSTEVETKENLATSKTIPQQNVEKQQKVKKTKEVKKEEKPQKEPLNEPIVDFGRLDLRVGKVEDVQKHPDADSLYVLKIKCGEDALRTVCSGLVKYIPIDDLRDRKVIVLCNLKPVKMRGVTSEAMVMCASTPELVEVLQPPLNSEVGDLVECEGYTRNPDSVMNPKKKIFETVAPDLATNNDLQACYKGQAWIVKDKGHILAASLKNCQVK